MAPYALNWAIHKMYTRILRSLSSFSISKFGRCTFLSIDDCAIRDFLVLLSSFDCIPKTGCFSDSPNWQAGFNRSLIRKTEYCCRFLSQLQRWRFECASRFRPGRGLAPQRLSSGGGQDVDVRVARFRPGGDVASTAVRYARLGSPGDVSGGIPHRPQHVRGFLPPGSISLEGNFSVVWGVGRTDGFLVGADVVVGRVVVCIVAVPVFQGSPRFRSMWRSPYDAVAAISRLGPSRWSPANFSIFFRNDTAGFRSARWPSASGRGAVGGISHFPTGFRPDRRSPAETSRPRRPSGTP